MNHPFSKWKPIKTIYMFLIYCLYSNFSIPACERTYFPLMTCYWCPFSIRKKWERGRISIPSSNIKLNVSNRFLCFYHEGCWKLSQIEIGTFLGAKLVRQDGLSSATSQKNVYASVVQFFLCNLDLRLPFTCRGAIHVQCYGNVLENKGFDFSAPLWRFASYEIGRRDSLDYRYRIESTDSKAAGISMGLDPRISWV